MYKVMLVDDDYPVLELLSEAINWEAELGLTLTGAYENGAAALEGAERDMPDILITDIGMPQMDGLELIGRLKERKPNLRVAILSCHSEFHYARRAMQLQVQDYIVKDTMEPGDLLPVLKRFVGSLDEERHLSVQQHRLQHMVDQSREAMRERWVHAAVQQPLLRSDTWCAELEGFGLPVEGRVLLPVIGVLDDLRVARGRFLSDETLRFAVTNIIDEVLRESAAEAVVFPYDERHWFTMHSFPPTLNVNGYDEARRLLERIREALRRTLKLSMSFIIGMQSPAPEKVNQELRTLLAGELQRFYMERGEIARAHKTAAATQEDLFAYYNEAIDSFRGSVMRKDAAEVRRKAIEWAGRIREKRFAPEIVKDWVLKLLLDIRLKHQSMHYFRNTQSADSLHKDAAELGSLLELQDWWIEHLLSAVTAAGESEHQSKRKEVLDAYQYVSLHLDQRIGLEEIAEHLHLNASYFSRLFKKETGETFIEYVIRMKMSRAKELLDQSAHSVTKISEMLGYDNQSYFIKLFKNDTGMTPIDYRNRVGEAKA